MKPKLEWILFCIVASITGLFFIVLLVIALININLD